MGGQGDAIALRDPNDRLDAAERGETIVDVARADLLGRLSSALVHEARNPLNAMAIHLEVLADKLFDEAAGAVPPNLAKNLDAARKQVRRLDDLLRAWGEFACRQNHEDDLAACLQRVVDLAAYHLRKAGVEVALDAPPGVPLAAADRIAQVVLQLVLVAAGRAAPGGQLALSGERDDREIRIALRCNDGSEMSASPGEALAVEAARAVARSLGGEIALEEGAQWSCTIALPPVATAPRVVT
ncbi:histidine kinase dimerization/phospho-acceptor domain-containing protein [Vulgatibacter sp.]|uniref:histidine kinase dimerization/phospho-acceptor domain-containing protein n=1 Tax=Vulgatibacter sp. TaxID=1971226 RepID=UPI0035641E4D